MTVRTDRAVPTWLDRGAALSWRLLLLAAALVVAGAAFTRLELVILPVVGAVFLSTVLVPPARWLRRHGVPALVATWAVFLALFAVIAGCVLAVAPSVGREFGQLATAISGGLTRVQHWLVHGPLHLSQRQVDSTTAHLRQQILARRGQLVQGALSGASVAIEVVGAVLLTVVLTFFFVKDGDDITSWMAELMPPERAREVDEVGRRTWRALTGYIRGTAVNGAVNASVMSAGLAIIGVPLIGPIALLTFVGGFLPIVGAIVSGVLAALVALVAKGPAAALVVVGLTILIHHLEGYLVGPLVLGRAVRLHPVAVLLALTTGGLLAGVVGAFLAVPVAAVFVAVHDYYRTRGTIVLPDAVSSEAMLTAAASGPPGDGSDSRRPSSVESSAR
jgi:predicted PurR-regulated permease PerM